MRKNVRAMSSLRMVLLFIFLWMAVPDCVPAQKLSVTAEPWPEYDALFARTNGWTGADGDYSVALTKDLILWLYSDTWVGEIRDNRHVDSVIVNNSVALQKGIDPRSADIRFFYGRDKDGKPAALIRPADGRGWFWIYDGALTKKGLALFLMQIDKAADGGFRHIGTWLGLVSNPFDPPDRWQVKQAPLPFGRFSTAGDTLFGSAVLRDGKFLYIYGTDEVIEDGWFHRKRMIAARVPVDKTDDFREWRFYSGSGWTADAGRAGVIADNYANEYSVSYQESLGKYVSVYTENGISPNIVVRTAPAPSGPWSEPQSVFRCPEAAWGEKIVCYAAKAHPELSRAPDELVVTYIASSSDFWQMATDARLYRPRFVRLKFR